MYSTAYIIISVLGFFLDTLPSSKLDESTALQITRFDKHDKRFKVLKVQNKMILICGKIKSWCLRFASFAQMRGSYTLVVI